jgi:hypothetical protein
MLAWLHQALAEESELLRAVLLGGNEGEGEWKQAVSEPLKSEAEPQAEAQAAESSLALRRRLLDSAFQAVCRPFRVRVEQMLAVRRYGIRPTVATATHECLTLPAGPGETRGRRGLQAG